LTLTIGQSINQVLAGIVVSDVGLVADVVELVVALTLAEVALVAGNTFNAMMLPSFCPSYMSPPYPAQTCIPTIIGLKKSEAASNLPVSALRQ
jgi:hypothetical protein